MLHAVHSYAVHFYKVRFGSLILGRRVACTAALNPELRTDLMQTIVDLDPTRVSIESPGGCRRTRRLTHDGRMISVVAARFVRDHGCVYRLLKPSPKNVTP